MAAAAFRAFWAEAHWGSRWGEEDQFHSTPHKGLDVALFHGIVDVFALTDGVVVTVGKSSLVGGYVTVKCPDDLFETYCHCVPGVKVGDEVAQGARLGRQATTQAEGGLQWQGQHTHFVLSRTRTGWGTWPTLDPTPRVIAVLTGTAGEGSTALVNKEEDSMYVRRTSTGLIALFNGTGEHDFANPTDYATHRSFVISYNSANPGDQQLVPPENLKDVMGVDEVAWPLVVAMYGAHPATSGGTPADFYSDADAARDLATITAQITALDKQSDTYQLELEAILNKGLTISGTAVPKV